jgi:CRISPR system Cascade subunit CasE
MYLSLLTLNRNHTQVRKDIANPYSMHQTLMHVVAADARPLWRLEQADELASPRLLVQTKAVPDWEELLLRFPGYAELAEDTPKAFHLHLHESQTLRYRLYANPTVTREGKRLGLYREEEQLAWLDTRLRSAGADVQRAMVTRRGKVVIRRPNSTVTLAAGQFDGVLVVANPELLLQAVTKGLGHAKAFGFGLLSLAPFGYGG